MRSLLDTKPLLLAAVLCVLASVGPAGAQASAPAESASARACRPVVNPYPNSRYEGSDLTRIRATGVSCRRARRVARGAHNKALERPLAGPVERFNWKGWRVTGDLRGDSDRYVAKRDGKRVRWRF